MKNQKTRILVEAALMVALSVILSRIQFAIWPQGGSITAAAMAPIVFLGLRHGVKWGLLTAFVFSLLQMLLDGIAPPPTQSFFWFALVVLLDYVVAYTVLGLAPLFARLAGGKLYAPAVGALCATGLRFLCHIVSGILIWGVYATIQPVWLYSVLYNGSYMVPEMILTTLVVALMSAKIKPTAAA